VESFSPHLEGLDEVEVVVRDVDVIILDLREGLLVLLHQLVDVHVLPFLYLVDLLLAFQVQVLPQDLDLHDVGKNCFRLLSLCSCRIILFQDTLNPFLASENNRICGPTI
jgi:hypothetical protein